MLELLLGRAGSGKTGAIYRMIQERVAAGRGENILIVPEQFSHDAERELARICPPEACLMAEILSFSRLAGRVFAEVGGLAARPLDKGGRTLAMSRAVTESAPQLSVYAFGSGRPDFLEGLLGTYDELRAAGTDSASLLNAAAAAEPGLSAKLTDLALIFEGYDRIKEESGLDATDRALRLAEALPKSEIGAAGHFYVDGFTDFTAPERSVLYALLKKDRELTVALTTPSLDAESEVFSLPAGTARLLKEYAEKEGVEVKITLLEQVNTDKPAELRFLERSLMAYTEESYAGECSAITLWSPRSTAEECTLAAGKVRALLMSGARCREIAVVSPTWGEYASLLRGTFEKFEIPINLSDRVNITEKPVLAHVLAAIELVNADWSAKTMLRYLKTGLTGLADEATDLLENYILKWNLRGKSRWTKGDWPMHPEGYRESMTEADRATLERVNAARRALIPPLLSLAEGLKQEETAGGKIQVIYNFLEDTGFYGLLEEKVAAFRALGRLRQADEYAQLWDILMEALEQTHDILRATRLSAEELAGLLKLVLGQYDVATIPSSVDRVGVGELRRTRGRGVKHLIVLGCTDTALPAAANKKSLLSDEERTALREMGLPLPDPVEDTLDRELGIIYSSFTMPSRSLTLSCPASARPSYLFTRVGRLFSLAADTPGEEVLLTAPRPALELAARDDSSASRLARAALERDPAQKEALGKLARAAEMPRGRLSHLTAERLYGREVTVSASRVDKFYSCRYLYFLQYGLRLRPRSEAALDAPESGTFIHSILEQVAAAARERGGFGAMSDDDLREETRQSAARYAETRLGGLAEKSGRFRYLFARLTADAERVVLTMAEELRASDFEPLSFELRFGRTGDLPPAATDNGVQLTGSVDRVDGWVHEGKLYLRVVDYKTGKRTFKLSDVYHGLNLQMLLYLFTLEKEGAAYYGREIVPAGVLYSPTRDPVISVPRKLEGAELEKARQKELRRSGLFLDEPALLEAMDKTESGEFLPVNLKRSREGLATMEELGALERHVLLLLAQMGDELRAGSIRADPYFRSQQDICCARCDYFGACHFGMSADDKKRYVSGLTSPEVWARLEEAKR